MSRNMENKGGTLNAPPGLFATPDSITDAESLLAFFLNGPTVGFAICDRHGRYKAINRALAAMNGIPPGAHLGKTVGEMIGKVAGQVESAFDRVFSTGQVLPEVEIGGELPSRTEAGYWVETYFPIRDSDAKVTRAGIVVVEVTEQKRLERSLRQLTDRLLCAREEAQRRIARDLHDSVDQYYAAHAGLEEKAASDRINRARGTLHRPDANDLTLAAPAVARRAGFGPVHAELPERLRGPQRHSR
jgi:signal transduction histidine kinase